MPPAGATDASGSAALPLRRSVDDYAFTPLCVGRHEDPAGHVLVAIKYRVNEIDNVCELGLERFGSYRHSLI
jgi:hypothetical protein